MVDESAAVATTYEEAAAKLAAIEKLTEVKNSKSKPNNLSAADMVNAAIKALAERNGSSLQAIRKYVGANHKMDADKHAIFIRRSLKTAVIAGTSVQTEEKGKSGSFKLAVKKAEVKAKPKVKAAPEETSLQRTAMKKSVKKSEAKAKGKKEASPKKIVKKAENVKTKRPSKVTKATKRPTTKPKTPKPNEVSKAKSATKNAIAQKK